MIRIRSGSRSGLALMRPSGSGRSGTCGGFTLIEITMAMIILVIALMSLSGSTMRSHTLRRQNRERAMAHNAVRSVSERVYSLSTRQAELSPETWASTITAALSPGGSIGTSFLVPGLGKGGSTQGTIRIFTDETLTDATLEEKVGMPRDLDGDGVATNTDVSNTARILPVVVTINWEGITGPSEHRHPFYIMGY